MKKLSNEHIGFIIHALRAKSERLGKWGKSQSPVVMMLAMTIGRIWRNKNEGPPYHNNVLQVTYTDWHIVLTAIEEAARYEPWWRRSAKECDEIIREMLKGKGSNDGEKRDRPGEQNSA